MLHETIIPEHRVRLSDFAIAKLLHLTNEDYQQLVHRPLDTVTDAEGNIIRFFMHISTNNKRELLNKLDMDSKYFVYFNPKDVYKLYS